MAGGNYTPCQSVGTTAKKAGALARDQTQVAKDLPVPSMRHTALAPLIGRFEALGLTAAQGLLAYGIIQNDYGALRRAVRKCWRFPPQFVSAGGLPWDVQPGPASR
jgi:hypothetical protein